MQLIRKKSPSARLNIKHAPFSAGLRVIPDGVGYWSDLVHKGGQKQPLNVSFSASGRSASLQVLSKQQIGWFNGKGREKQPVLQSANVIMCN